MSAKKLTPGKRISMLRRHASHNYQAPGFYMITLTTLNRAPILGTLVAPDGCSASSASPRFAIPASSASSSYISSAQSSPSANPSPSAQSVYSVLDFSLASPSPSLPFVRLSTIGSAVVSQWKALPSICPQLQPLRLQVMPDHIHGILQVLSSLPAHLGRYIAAFKQNCAKSAYRSLALAGKLASASSFVEFTSSQAARIWNPDYHDRIIRHFEQLQTCFAYLRDNPRRLWLKRHNPELFAQLPITVAGIPFVSIGNVHLLNEPLLPVRISSKLSDSEIRQEVNRYISEAQHGSILVSPFISPAEKSVERAVSDAALPLVKLMDNGFSELYKPPGREFDACATGRLLLLAPWEHHHERRHITRGQCLALNEMALAISQRNEFSTNEPN